MPHQPLKLTPENLAECRNVRALFNEQRDKYGMTQEQFGKALDLSGKSISAMINGHMRVSIRVARKMAEQFNVPLPSILPWTASLEKERVTDKALVMVMQVLDKRPELLERFDDVVANLDLFYEVVDLIDTPEKRQALEWYLSLDDAEMFSVLDLAERLGED